MCYMFIIISLLMSPMLDMLWITHKKNVILCYDSSTSFCNHPQVGIEGITYAGNHGLEILHPDGSKFVHPMPMECQGKVVGLLKSLQEQVLNA
jgi:hypothetical protein